MKNLNYEIYSMSGQKVHQFQSIWKYKENEQVFVWLGAGKKNFIINHITHDVFEDGKHVVRLYVQERKLYGNN